MEQKKLLEEIRRRINPLLSPTPLAHSQELAADLPMVRRHVGPRAWYQCLDPGSLPSTKRD